MLAIGVQTDVIGVHWIAYVLFALAGAAIGGGLPDDGEADGVKALGLRIGLYRVAAILIGCALVLEILRVEVLSGSRRRRSRARSARSCSSPPPPGVFMLARRRSARP